MISLIAAVAKNGVIGSKNTLPWYIPEDLKHFKEVTMGKTVLMGRNTYDSIIARNGKPLVGRKNIVISRRTDLKMSEGVMLFAKLEDAFAMFETEPEIIVIGGGETYKHTIRMASKLYITEVHKDAEGDVFFPPIDKNIWKETSRQDHPEYSFVTYDRIT